MVTAHPKEHYGNKMLCGLNFEHAGSIFIDSSEPLVVDMVIWTGSLSAIQDSPANSCAGKMDQFYWTCYEFCIRDRQFQKLDTS